MVHTKHAYKDIISVPELSCYANWPPVVLGKIYFSRINRPFSSEVNLAFSSYSPIRYGAEDKGIRIYGSLLRRNQRYPCITTMARLKQNLGLWSVAVWRAVDPYVTQVSEN